MMLPSKLFCFQSIVQGPLFIYWYLPSLLRSSPYVFTQILRYGQNATHDWSLAEYRWFKLGFFSSGQVTLPKKEDCLFYYLPIAGWNKRVGFMSFPRAIAWKWDAKGFIQDLNLIRFVHFLNENRYPTRLSSLFVYITQFSK